MRGMTWSGSWSRWSPAQAERKGSAIAAAISLTARAHAMASMQARQPKRDSRLEACSALKAQSVKVESSRRAEMTDRTMKIRAGAPPKQNHRLRVVRTVQDRSSKLPRFGMSTKPDNAARIVDGAT